MSATIRLGDIVRLKGEKREGRVVAIGHGSPEAEPDITIVYPRFDDEGVPYAAGESVTAPAHRFERPRVAKGDIAYSPEHDVEGLVVYTRGDYATLHPRGGGLPVNVRRDALVRLNHYSDEGMNA